MTTMDIESLVKAVVLTSSGLWAGYNWALSNAAMPAILETPNEAILLNQWRYMWLKAFALARPTMVLHALSFGYLAYLAPTSSLLRRLYILAAIFTSSGPPFAVIPMRYTNGALANRTHKLHSPGNGVIALTFAQNDKGVLAREKTWTTPELIRSWRWHNNIRVWVLAAGTFLGGLAMAMQAVP